MRRKAEQQERMERLKISIDKAKESLRLINEGTLKRKRQEAAEEADRKAKKEADLKAQKEADRKADG